MEGVSGASASGDLRVWIAILNYLRREQYSDETTSVIGQGTCIDGQSNGRRLAAEDDGDRLIHVIVACGIVQEIAVRREDEFT